MTTEEFKSNVEYVLRNCTFRKCDSVQSKREIIKQVDCADMFIRLFQYRCVNEKIIDCLRYGTIYFKSPVRFNDPYDSLMCWDERLILGYFNKPRYRDILPKLHIIDSDTLVVGIRNRFRISCFSEVPDSPLMWAHYAHNGTGFCVEYEFSPCIGNPMCLKNGQPCQNISECNPITCGCFCKCSLVPVVYSAHRPDATSAMKQEIEYVVACELGEHYDLNDYDWLEPYRTTLFKSKDWAYEKEWRLILSDHRLNGNQECQYASGGLMRVILGPRMDPLDEYKVSKAVEAYAKYVRRDVELSKLYVDIHSEDYKFNIRHEHTIRGQ